MRSLQYLDTSAVRGLGARLASVQRQRSVFTSVLTVIELVSGLTAGEHEYRRRRANILDLVRAGLRISWELPEGRIYQAFPFLGRIFKASENATGPLRSLMQRLEACPTLDLFEAVRCETTIKELLVWIDGYEERLSREFMEATNLGAGEVRRAFRAAPQEQLARLSRLGIRIDGSLADLCQSLVAHSLNRDLMLYALASGLSQTLVNDSSEEMLRAIFESYDHSIDAYIDAFAHYSTMKKGLGGSAGRNDGFDLAHFLYLVPGTALITEDTRMRDLARAIGWPVESIPGVAGRI